MSSLKDVTKFEHLNFAQWMAYAIKGGGLANVIAVLQGKMIITVEPNFFDQTGRRVVSLDLKKQVKPPKQGCRFEPLEQTKYRPKKISYDPKHIRYSSILKRLKECLPDLPCEVTADEFRNRSKELLAQLKQKQTVSNLLKGVHLPLLIPQLPISSVAEFTTVVKQLLLPAVKKAYQDQAPDEGSFENYDHGNCLEKAVIDERSCHQQLIEMLIQGPVVGIYFPAPLQGFSVEASLEQMADLPQGLMLNGAVDTMTALVVYRKELVYDFHTEFYHPDAPHLTLAALAHDNRSWDFSSFVESLSIGSVNNTEVCDRSSAGLLFIGFEEFE